MSIRWSGISLLIACVFVCAAWAGCNSSPSAEHDDGMRFLLMYEESGGFSGEVLKLAVISSERDIDSVMLPTTAHVGRGWEHYVVPRAAADRIRSLLSEVGFQDWKSYDSTVGDAVKARLYVESADDVRQVVVEDVTDERAEAHEALAKMRSVVNESMRIARRHGRVVRH